MTMRNRLYLIERKITTTDTGELDNYVYPLGSSFDREKLEKKLAEEVEIQSHTIDDGKVLVRERDHAVLVKIHYEPYAIETELTSFFITDNYCI